MATSNITIPKKITKGEELVIITRREYEELLGSKETSEFKPTSLQRKALERAENNLRRGRTLSYNELVQKLGFTN